MTLVSEIAARSLGLPRPRTRQVDVIRDLRIAMEDGAVLLADRWVPATAATGSGASRVVLVRTPYGRRGVFGLVYGRLLAERGFQVVVQSVRGTFGSEGTFAPFDERADGLATIRWLEAQPWCRGPIGMIGSSYMGIAQWAVAEPAGASLGALSPSISASHVHGQAYGGGSVSLETALSWVLIVALQDRRLAPLQILREMRRRLPAAFDVLPLGELDELLTGAAIPYYREWFAESGSADPYWVARDYAQSVPRIAAPVQLVGGWHDIFLPWMVDDFLALRRAGREVQLVIGPWAHVDPGLLAASTRAGLAWLRAWLLGDRRLLREGTVQVWVGGGARCWRTFDDWPPPGARPWRLYLQSHAALAPELPPAGSATSAGRPSHAAAGGRDRGLRLSVGEGLGATPFRYDPADPTPSLGGPALLARTPVVDNAPLERRRDVLVFTTPTLLRDVEAIGPVEAEIYLRSDNAHADVFVRVCDVDPSGRSLNVCDALVRLRPEEPPADADGVRRVAFRLWPAAHRFDRHHRIRVLIAGGAHPRYARNTGTDEPLATATRLVPVTHELLHDAAHPSAVMLTVLGA